MHTPTLHRHRNHPLGDVRITTATPDDLAYIDYLQQLHCNNTGFVPRCAIADHLERHDYHLLSINGQPTGYSMHGGGVRRPFKVNQIALTEDAWRQGLGATLIALALDRASHRPKPNMTATIRDGLTANLLVQATGATITATEKRSTARRKDLVHWSWTNEAPSDRTAVAGLRQRYPALNSTRPPAGAGCR